MYVGDVVGGIVSCATDVRSACPQTAARAAHASTARRRPIRSRTVVPQHKVSTPPQVYLQDPAGELACDLARRPLARAWRRRRTSVMDVGREPAVPAVVRRRRFSGHRVLAARHEEPQTGPADGLAHFRFCVAFVPILSCIPSCIPSPMSISIAPGRVEPILLGVRCCWQMGQSRDSF